MSVVVVGAGGMGREAAAWLVDLGLGDQLVGYLDDDQALHDTSIHGVPVLGGVDRLPDGFDGRAVVAIGRPATRAEVARRLAAAGVSLLTVVHPSAIVGPRVELGPGTIICPGAILTCDVTVGAATIVNYGAMIGHDGRIGDAAFVGPGARIAGTVTVESQVEVGVGATIIQGVTVGERAVVGAGAVVIRDVDPDTTVVGVPAAPVGRGS